MKRPVSKISKFSLLIVSSLALSGCYAGSLNLLKPDGPKLWQSQSKAGLSMPQAKSAESLKAWWKGFKDPSLDALVDRALKDSPDRAMAQARILEARGLKRTAQSALFPQIGSSAQQGRSQSALGEIGDFYDASFDASFELDIFGVQRNASDAASAEIIAQEALYHDTSLTLVAEVARNYIDYRVAQKQVRIAEKNLQIQKKSLELVRNLERAGEVPQLDVERAENLVNTTQSTLPEFQRQADNARLALSVLTGALPKDVSALMFEKAEIPGGDVKPVLLAPAEVLAVRPDIRAAEAVLKNRTDLADSVTATLFPTLSLSGLYGVTDTALVNSATIWNIAAGAAFTLLDFGRIEGQIDAARAREKMAYEAYRKTILQAVTEVETAMVDYSAVHQQQASLARAYQNAQRSFTLSQKLFEEGETSFIDVLDAQRSLNSADEALIRAEAQKSQAIVRLYKALGVY